MIRYYPSDSLSNLEFDKILELSSSYCIGTRAKELVLQTKIETSAHHIEKKLRETDECKKIIDQGLNFPLLAYEDWDNSLSLLSVEGYVMGPDHLKKLSLTLRGILSIIDFFKPQTDYALRFPTLYSYAKTIDFPAELYQFLQTKVNSEGLVRTDASPELSKIIKLQDSKKQEIDKKFRSIVLHYQSKSMLADQMETFRNGRSVLTVLVEYKRQIKGIIHDESASGKTVYLEPEELIELNNDLFDLEQDYAREVYKILKQISDWARPHIKTIEKSYQILLEWDCIRARTLFSRQIHGNKPILIEKQICNLTKAVHPILFLKNLKKGQKTVPFSVQLDHNHSILIISGPNAGGKSICMKAIGLIQIMAQAGFLIPAEEGSTLGIVDGIFTDIGDHQSIEDELSTYSSRLKHASYMLTHSTQNSMIFIDELGSGTDPKLGALIAEGILRELSYKKCLGVITTHFPNIKNYSYEQRGFLNAHMTFHVEKLIPTYQLEIGKPGSSYTFEIASQSGLPQRIIQYARRKLGEKEEKVEDLMVDLQKDKQRILQKELMIEERQKSLNQLIHNYDQSQKELEIQRKKLKVLQKELEFKEQSQGEREIQQFIKELRKDIDKEKTLQKAQEELNRLKEAKEISSKTIEEKKEEIFLKYETVEMGPIEVGSLVKLKNGGLIGEVLEIQKNEVEVQLEHIKIKVKLRDLQKVSSQIEINQNHKIKAELLGKKSYFEPKIDIRGLRYEDALIELEQFLDEALLTNSVELRIIHGRGTGALKKAVYRKLKEYPGIKEIKYAEANQGGDGQTIVVFE